MHGSILEQGELVLVIVMSPQSHEDTYGSTYRGGRVAEYGVGGVNEPPLLLPVHLVEHVVDSSVVEWRPCILYMCMVYGE